MPNKSNNQTTLAIGERLRRLRLKHKLTQQAFAEKLGISTSHYSKIELGIGSIGDGPLLKAADLFETTYDWLHDGLKPGKSADSDNGSGRIDSTTPLPSREDILRILQLMRNPKVIRSAEDTAAVLGISLPRALRVIISSMMH